MRRTQRRHTGAGAARAHPNLAYKFSLWTLRLSSALHQVLPALQPVSLREKSVMLGSGSDTRTPDLYLPRDQHVVAMQPLIVTAWWDTRILADTTLADADEERTRFPLDTTTRKAGQPRHPNRPCHTAESHGGNFFSGQNTRRQALVSVEGTNMAKQQSLQALVHVKRRGTIDLAGLKFAKACTRFQCAG